MTPESEKIIRAFADYRHTKEIKFIEKFSFQELTNALVDLSRFTSDWFYPMIERRARELVTPHTERKNVVQTEKPKGFLKKLFGR